MIQPMLHTLAQTEVTPAIIEKLRFVVPEVVVFIGACVVMMLGLSRKSSVRRACRPITIASLAIAGVIAMNAPSMETSLLPHLSGFMKVLVAIIGILLALLMTGVVDRDYETMVAKGASFDAIRSTSGEFYAFFLFSLMGLMLCATADDLIWLFLALELTSLPTYVMVSISGGSAKGETRAQEAGVKYFFLGAFGAAMFVMGFTLLYGATGTTTLFGEGSISEVLARNIAENGSIGPIATLGAVFSIVGICFKIAAVPMHFYTADVYQGAATPVSAFLAFVPKAAGFIALMLIVAAIGWNFGSADSGSALVSDHSGSLPESIRVLLWVIAALTMVVGNVMALLQRSVKRILAYSSIAHSGYMLVGLIAGPGNGTSGLAAILFYLLCYGVMNLGAFGVIACLEYDKDGQREEVEDIDDLRGLCRSRPLLGITMVICSLSLLGLPILLGFMGKLFLFASGISAGEIALVVVMAINSAIAAYYYLRLAFFPMLESRSEDAEPMQTSPFGARTVASVISAGGVLALIPFTQALWSQADHAATYTGIQPLEVVTEQSPATDPGKDEHAAYTELTAR